MSREFTRKEDLRHREYHTDGTNKILHWFSSSGTTSVPVIYPWTADDERIANATLERIYSGPTHLDRTTGIVIAPTGLPSMWMHMNRQLHYMGVATAFSGVDNPSLIMELISQLKPSLLISLPLVLSRLGELLTLFPKSREHKPAYLYTAGDILSDSRRARLSALWDCPVKHFYGLSEIFGPLASEKDNGNLLSWQADEVMVELLNPVTGKPIEEGQTGVAVYTTLWDRPASLNRYWSGDYFELIQWQKSGSPCFRVRGREQVGLPGLKPEYHPIDVDNLLLSDQAAGMEWRMEVENGQVILFVETQSGQSLLSSSTIEKISSMFQTDVRVECVSPGRINRNNPKLGIPNIISSLP